MVLPAVSLVIPYAPVEKPSKAPRERGAGWRPEDTPNPHISVSYSAGGPLAFGPTTRGPDRAHASGTGSRAEEKLPMKHNAILLSAVLSLTGCASSGLASTEDRLALYKAHSTPV